MTVIGIISDTHAPDRLPKLPSSIFEVLAGVDLIVHAGDVGEVWVLEQLSSIAPVVAVHGNDETEDAKTALPYLQTITISGQRIVLTHSHYPDVAEEMEKRKDDHWEPKLERLSEVGKQHSAHVVVYGHTHIPMSLFYNDVLLINPGAIASAGNIYRQKLQSVARMTVEARNSIKVDHIDLAHPYQTFMPSFDYWLGFQETSKGYQESILEPQLEALLPWLRREVYPLAPEFIAHIVHRLSQPIWAGEQHQIRLQEVVQEINTDETCPPILRAKLSELPIKPSS